MLPGRIQHLLATRLHHHSVSINRTVVRHCALLIYMTPVALWLVSHARTLQTQFLVLCIMAWQHLHLERLHLQLQVLYTTILEGLTWQALPRTVPTIALRDVGGNS